MATIESGLSAKLDVNKEKDGDILIEEIDASRICNSFEQDARRYKKFLGENEKMMYR